jgi:hypothetical protein
VVYNFCNCLRSFLALPSLSALFLTSATLTGPIVVEDVRPVKGSPWCAVLDAHQEALDRDEGVRSGHRFLRLVAGAVEVARDRHRGQVAHGGCAVKRRVLRGGHAERDVRLVGRDAGARISCKKRSQQTSLGAGSS